MYVTSSQLGYSGSSGVRTSKTVRSQRLGHTLFLRGFLAFYTFLRMSFFFITQTSSLIIELMDSEVCRGFKFREPHCTLHHRLIYRNGGVDSSPALFCHIFRRRLCHLFDPREAQLVHLDGELEQIIQTLALGLRLGNVVAPDIAMKIVSGFNSSQAAIQKSQGRPYIPCLRTSTA